MSNFLSYLFTGLPAASSERAKQTHQFLSYALITIMVMLMLLATVPSWPLSIGMVAGFAAICYMAHLIVGSPTDDSQ
jgi:nitrate reductase NapE component